jgi:hypothetical protein
MPKKMEWPGIATAVGIILILTLILVGWRDDFHLKDWQPLIAAFVALAGGALAYRGAMAKVEQDADKNKRELLRRQLGLYLKLDITVRNFRDAAEGAGSKITFGEAGDRIRVGDMRLKEPPEIEEAWDNLDIFPRRIIREIASLRESLRELNLILFNLQDEDKLVVEQEDARATLDYLGTIIGSVADACSVIANVLAPEIEQLAPAMPTDERMVVVYGEPSASD